MIQSHDNLTWSPFSMFHNAGFRMAEETNLSYLPPSHSSALVVDGFMFPSMVGTVYFADRDALKGKLVDNLKDVRPTILVAVPRVLEKIEERIRDGMAGQGAVKRGLLAWAAKEAHKHLDKVRQAGPPVKPGAPSVESRPPPIKESMQYKLAKKLILK